MYFEPDHPLQIYRDPFLNSLENSRTNPYHADDKFSECGIAMHPTSAGMPTPNYDQTMGLFWARPPPSKSIETHSLIHLRILEPTHITPTINSPSVVLLCIQQALACQRRSMTRLWEVWLNLAHRPTILIVKEVLGKNRLLVKDLRPWRP